MIKIHFIGYLGKDAITNTVNGSNVINFNVAHTEKFYDAKNQLQEKTTWVDCAYWVDKLGVLPYLTKGTQVYVEGIPEAKAYTTKEGKAAASLAVRVLMLRLLGSAKNTEQSVIAPNKTEFTNKEEVLEELPF